MDQKDKDKDKDKEKEKKKEKEKEKEKIQVLIRFSRTYGLSSSTLHPPQYQSQIDHSANSRRVRSKPPSCLFDHLPEDILHSILSRLPIPELLMAQQSCSAWYRIISSCRIFQGLYDETNQQSWIGLRCNFRRIHDGFVLFNTNNIDQYCFLSMPQHMASPVATTWHLQGVADGLMLLASIEGRLAVVNPLTRRFRQLPDARISSRLRLESYLKKMLEHRDDQKPSISVNIAVDSASRTFKVMVLGEMRARQIHALIYSSLTNTWIIRLCSEIDHTLFHRRLFHATVNGNDIYCASINPRNRNSPSIYPRWMVSYNTETQLSVVDEMRVMDLSVIGNTICQRVETIGIVNYQSRIFLLGVIDGYHAPMRRGSFTVVALWEANPSAGKWTALTATPPEWLCRCGIDFWRCELAAAYDGERIVTIIARSGSIRTILLELNLDTKEWNMLWNHNIAAEINNSVTLTPISGNKGLKTFRTKLKFCTAV